MPLEHGKSKAAFGHNVKTEMAAGKSQKQSVAIAYSERGEKKMADGGMVDEDHESLMDGCAHECFDAIEAKDHAKFRGAIEPIIAHILTKMSYEGEE